MMDEKSASRWILSMADLSRPVTSWMARGICQEAAVMSLTIAFSVPALLSTLNVVQPRPFSFAMSLLPDLVEMGGEIVDPVGRARVPDRFRVALADEVDRRPLQVDAVCPEA